MVARPWGISPSSEAMPWSFIVYRPVGVMPRPPAFIATAWGAGICMPSPFPCTTSRGFYNPAPSGFGAPAAMASKQPAVGIIMGSQSDWQTMQRAAETLEALGIAFETRIVSAHRTPKRLYAYAESAAGRGLKVIIAG